MRNVKGHGNQTPARKTRTTKTTRTPAQIQVRWKVALQPGQVQCRSKDSFRLSFPKFLSVDVEEQPWSI